MSLVSIVTCKSYQRNELHESLAETFSLLGGLENIIKRGSSILVKINHLSPPSQPERAIITHPAFTRAVLSFLKDLGCQVTVGDDIQSKDRDGFLISKYRQVCGEMGVRLVNFKELGFRRIPCQGDVLKEVLVSPLVLETDYLLNLPKLKTHALTVFTGAVKNLFGVIPYGLRLTHHSRYSDQDSFARMLVDIFSCAKPSLSIMDAVVAMEGEGPSGGNPRKAGLILASRDAVALDSIACRLIGISPFQVNTTVFAHQRGLGEINHDKILVTGGKIEDLIVKGFKPSRAVNLTRKKLPQTLYAFIQDQLHLIPEIIPSRCTACLECLNVCPCQAISLQNEKAVVNKNLCLHCLCCHEVCRYQAVELKQRIFGRLVRMFSDLRERVFSKDRHH
ncbi:MAG: DUF362 domain-containing protein [Acidobacteriota bacterium]